MPQFSNFSWVFTSIFFFCLWICFIFSINYSTFSKNHSSIFSFSLFYVSFLS